MATIVEVKYFNSFWMKKLEKSGATPASSRPVWPGLEWNPFGYPAFPIQADTSGTNKDKNWYIEEARIRGGFNNTMVSQGVRAYLNEEENIRFNNNMILMY